MLNRRSLPVWAALLALPAAAASGEEPTGPPQVQQPTPASSEPVPIPPLAVLHSGARVTLRVRQVFPCDGLSPGDRVLNGRLEIQPGDRFLAELINPPSCPLPLVGGTVVKVIPPGRHGRPGRLILQVAQLVEKPDGTEELKPWLFNTEDRRHKTLSERALLTALFGLEGAMFGASIAGEVAPKRSPVFIGGGTAAGVVLGLGYAGFRHGVEASLEQGDTFDVVVGTTSYRPVPRASLTTVYPAPNPSQRKVKEKGHP